MPPRIARELNTSACVELEPVQAPQLIFPPLVEEPTLHNADFNDDVGETKTQNGIRVVTLSAGWLLSIVFVATLSSLGLLRYAFHNLATEQHMHVDICRQYRFENEKGRNKTSSSSDSCGSDVTDGRIFSNLPPPIIRSNLYLRDVSKDILQNVERVIPAISRAIEESQLNLLSVKCDRVEETTVDDEMDTVCIFLLREGHITLRTSVGLGTVNIKTLTQSSSSMLSTDGVKRHLLSA